MSFMRLQGLRLVHLISGLDEQEPGKFDGAIPAYITGYTDWVSDTFPTVTIGWDWLMEGCCGRVMLSRPGEPRSNILLLDSLGRDVPAVKSAAVLETYLDGIAWTGSVEHYIRQRYKIWLNIPHLLNMTVIQIINIKLNTYPLIFFVEGRCERHCRSNQRSDC